MNQISHGTNSRKNKKEKALAIEENDPKLANIEPAIATAESARRASAYGADVKDKQSSANDPNSTMNVSLRQSLEPRSTLGDDQPDKQESATKFKE